MTRVLRILLLALLLAPPVIQGLEPLRDYCSEREDCCDTESMCHENCVKCACCVSRTPVSPVLVAQDDADTPRSLAVITATAIPASEPPSDIPHVPKSA